MQIKADRILTMKTAVIALLAPAVAAAFICPTGQQCVGYCAQGKGDLCHGPAGAGPSPSDQTTDAAGSFTLDPSQWLCAGGDSTTHEFTTSDGETGPWNSPNITGDFCNSKSTIGANSACPAFCGLGDPLDIQVPYPSTPSYANSITGGTACSPKSTCSCYGATADPPTEGCDTQERACNSFQVLNAGAKNPDLKFANEIPFADTNGGLHARCSGSVLTAFCLPCHTDATTGKKACDCAGGTGDIGTKPVATYANCADWSEQCTQIPTHAQWVEDYVTQVYADGYDLANSKYDAALPGGWGRHIPGYFHGIVPNYKTSVQLEVGQLVLVRIWESDAASIMPDADANGGGTYYPTGDTPFEASGVAYEGICGDKAAGQVQTTDLASAGTGYKGRKWCWKRGKIAIDMAQDTYVVTIEGSAAVVKGVTAYDVRPICFDAAPTASDAQNQEAECSARAGSCTNMAGTVGKAGAQGIGFKYELNQAFAVDNLDGTIDVKTVNCINQGKQMVTTKDNIQFSLKDPKVLHCFQIDDKHSTEVTCPNAYNQTNSMDNTKTANAHYGMEIMNIKKDTSGKHSFTYTIGTIKSFADNTFQKAIVKECDAADDSWDLTLVTATTNGVLPICYDVPAVPPPAPGSRS